MPNQPLVTQVKNYLKENYNLTYNLVNRNIELDGTPVNDMVLNSIYVACKAEYGQVTKDLVFSVVYSDNTPQVNPFTSFIAAHLERPGAIGNIDKLIASIHTDTANHDLFITKWLCAMMASIHGKHSPLMLVLCGGQNTGKTEFFRRLLPNELCGYYAESKLDGGKDDEILMTKKLIIVDDEMGGKSKQENKKLKEMTSKQTFSIREPYGRVSVDLQRLAMLCGTTNDLEVLNDPTGNRRLLPIHVLSIDHELYNSIDKTDLLMEIYNLYQSDYNYNLSQADIELLNTSTGDFEEIFAEQELITKFYAIPGEDDWKASELTNGDIALRIQPWSVTRINTKRLGSLLKKLGFKQRIIKQGKTARRVYSVIELNP